MGTKIFSAVLSALVLATASVGVTASAEEIEDMPDTAAVVEAGAEQSDIDSSVSDDTYDMEKYREIMNNLENAEGMEITADYENDPYYDTDGNATLIKSERIVYNSEEMQFIAVTTKDGHVFYVLINYSAENAEDQVFFLNKVDDYDLYALLYAGDDNKDSKITPEQAHQAAEKANGRVTGSATDGETAETAEDGEATSEPAVQAKPVPMSKNSMMLVFGALALIGVGGAGFFIMKKKNGGNKTAVKFEPEYEDETEITEDDDDMNFYDHQDDEE